MIPDDPEDVALAKKVTKVRIKNSSSLAREERIAKRKGWKHAKRGMEVREAGVCDFHVPTNKFLQMLQK